MEKLLGINNNLTSRQIRRQDDNNSGNKLILLTGNHKDTTNFCGYASKANYWISNGGLVKSFLILDTCGFIMPRIIQALFRNRQEIGGLNWKAATEEAIREFLSGPGILVIPLALILVAKKRLGKATNIDNKTLRYLSGKFEGLSFLVSGDVTKSKEGFYKKIVGEALKPFEHDGHKIVPGQENKSGIEVIEDIKSKIIELDSQKLEYEKFGFFKKLFAKKDSPAKTLEISISKLKEDIIKAVVDLNNHHRTHSNNKDHVSLGSGKEQFEIDIKNFVEFIHNYTDDIVKKASKRFSEGNVEKMIKDLNQRANGGRRFLNLIAMIGTVGFTCAVPMLYKRYNKFPGTEGLRCADTKSPEKKEIT